MLGIDLRALDDTLETRGNFRSMIKIFSRKKFNGEELVLPDSFDECFKITTTIVWKEISRLRLQRHWRRTITLIAVWRARRKIDAFLVLIKDA